MPKNVVITRQMQLVLEKGEEPKGHRDYAVIPNDLYEAHPDWFQLIEDVPVEDRPAEALEELTVDELKEHLRERDLATSGNKPELIERLTHA
ncbi:hypothetical protein FIV42_00695 [Persicimonas caeni]|uniref:SAP domain-containing protein n=1 Tax=Persicimonas caeni TaxID=2292766 RepID=A0A4Y6PM10_PERCE|nr:SAP domain-containing protein [Persicimonas caeni]QDG49302.1 hypothetical protein FIV42_00695 [Persicimonas caeni]QED30523.1 hypothetical protein FRD00_00690 [Persicimonas caeni]